MEKASTVSDVQSLLAKEEYDFRYHLCIGHDVHNLSDRDNLIKSIALYYTVVRIKAQLDQLMEGLSVMGVLEVIQANPNKAVNLFVYKKERMCADKIIEMFTPQFSPLGSNAREEEEQTMLLWVHFVQLIESK